MKEKEGLQGKEKPKNQLRALVEAQLVIEKLRVQSQVRISHLKRRNRSDVETEKLHERIVELEEYVDGTVARLIIAHPAYPWFSRVKGVGKENIGKVVGLIEAFDHYYEQGDSMIPGFVNRELEIYTVMEGDKAIEKEGIWVKGIERLPTISALWKYTGFDVWNGAAPIRVKGSLTTYNSRLRSMCWRLGSSLLRAQGKFYNYYLNEKDKEAKRQINKGVEIVPAASLPKKGSKRYETKQFISEGHVHNRAMRKMIKLFLACLWLVWREAEGLPTTSPYAIGQLGHHSFISPEDMADKQAAIKKDKAVNRAKAQEKTREKYRANVMK